MSRIYQTTPTSLAIIIDGVAYNITNANPMFEQIKRKVCDTSIPDSKLVDMLDQATALINFVDGEITYDRASGLAWAGDISLDGEWLALVQKYATAGRPAEPLAKFFKLLSRNPSQKSVSTLWPFMANANLGVDADGYIIAFKAVRNDWFSITGGDNSKVIQGVVNKQGQIRNAPGDVIKVQRNYVADDPDVACGPGIHAGSKEYAEIFGSIKVACPTTGNRMIVVRIDPADVVSVPKDCNAGKVRVAQYTVLEQFTGVTPAVAFFDKGDIPTTPYKKDAKEGDDFASDEECCDDCGQPIDECECDGAICENCGFFFEGETCDKCCSGCGQINEECECPQSRCPPKTDAPKAAAPKEGDKGDNAKGIPVTII